MKTIKKIMAALTLTSLSLVGAACSCGGKKLSQRVENFEVTAQDAAEIGQYYTPDIPEATLDGKAAVVSVSAKQNGKDLVFNSSNALLVSSFDDIVITYTIINGDEKLEKSTLLKVEDTTAPYIVTNSLPESVYSGVTFDCFDYIKIGDLSGVIEESSIMVTDQTGAKIETDNGVFTLPEDSPITALTIAIKAKDGRENEAEKTLTIPVKNAPLWNEPINFSSPEMSKIIATTAGASVETAEKNGEAALKIAHTAPWSGSTSNLKTIFQFTENIANYTCFDYIKLVVSVKTDCNIDIPRAMKADEEKHFKFGASTEESEKIELYYDMQWIKNADTYVVSGNAFQLQVRLLESQHKDKENPENHPAQFNVELYIYEFEFGYYEREVSNEKRIDLTEFGIQAEEVVSAMFTPEEGGETQALDLSGWIPQKGVLTITLKKDGYRMTTVEIPILPVPTYIGDSADAEKDTDAEYAW